MLIAKYKASAMWLVEKRHCVKNDHIQSYSGPHFAAFRLNEERYSFILRIQSKCEKMGEKWGSE